jgi:hypothetical protein
LFTAHYSSQLVFPFDNHIASQHAHSIGHGRNKLITFKFIVETVTTPVHKYVNYFKMKLKDAKITGIFISGNLPE